MKDLNIRVDLHADVLWRSQYHNDYDFGKLNSVGHVDLPRLKLGKVNLQVWAVFVESKFKPHLTLEKTFRQIETFYKIVEKYERDLQILKSIDDLDCKEKIILLLSLEGGDSIGEDLYLLDLYYRLGVRSIGFTWNQRNQIADGVWEGETGGGLTSFGRKLVKQMNSLGMLIDLAHMSEKGFNDAIFLTDQPIIVSHANCRSICKHPRNLTDQQLKILAENNGLLGITFYPYFLTGTKTATINDVIKHIIHVADLIGVDYIGIGSDFDGIDATTEGLEDISKFGELEFALSKAGFNHKEIRKILGGNSIRVIEKVLK